MKSINTIVLAATLLMCSGMGVELRAQQSPETVMALPVMRSYTKIKSDMEEKARTVKEMPELNPAQREDFELAYKAFQRQCNHFVTEFSSDLAEADRTKEPISTQKISGQFQEEFDALYKNYEEEIVVRYESLTGRTSRPLLKARNYADTTPDQPMMVDMKAYRRQVEPELRVTSWATL
jgi:hypothetical protein